MAKRQSAVPYSNVPSHDLILRDQLAIERTALANERTVLAYFRSSLGILAAAITLIHFFDLDSARITGFAMLPFAPALMSWGLWRFVQVRRQLRQQAGG